MNQTTQVVELPRSSIVPSSGRMSVAEVTQHAIAVQEVMKAVMKEGVHYGVIPFTDKPTLYKAGAEKLCMTFRIADDYEVEDLSTPDGIRYRVTCIGKHQQTEMVLGSGMGEGSTGEEKYKWRKAVCTEEFAETPPNMRRRKYAKGKNNTHYVVEQVRTEPSDLANTVLKMACKRAKMAMVLNVTAASDCFTQDLEDLDDVLREHLAEEDHGDIALRDEWVAKANATTTADALASIWKEGVAAINAARDKPAYTAFKATVAAKGKALTQAPAEPDKPATAAAQELTKDAVKETTKEQPAKEPATAKEPAKKASKDAARDAPPPADDEFLQAMEREESKK